MNEDGILKSPNYPEAYNVNTTCIWILRVPPSNNVAIKFQTFEVRYIINMKCKDFKNLFITYSGIISFMYFIQCTAFAH